MRPSRLAACAAAVTVAASPAVSPAAGAGKPCHLAVDARGDQSDKAYTGMVRTVSTDLDLLSADLASDDRLLTAAFRVATLRELDLDSPGHYYLVEFQAGGRAYSLSATHGADGTNGFVRAGDHSGRTGGATVVVDYERREVRVSAPVMMFRLTAGERVTRIVFWSAEHRGISGRHDDAEIVIEQLGTPPGSAKRVDHVKAARAYVAGSPTCVPVGA